MKKERKKIFVWTDMEILFIQFIWHFFRQDFVFPFYTISIRFIRLHIKIIIIIIFYSFLKKLFALYYYKNQT